MIILNPSLNIAAYSNSPVIVSSDNYQQVNFRYLINICWDELEIDDVVAIPQGSEIYAQIETATPHNYLIGQDLFINTGEYFGYYHIISVVDDTHFILNFTPVSGYTGGDKVCRYFRYSMPPDQDGVAKLDISGTLKDFVASNIVDGSNYIDGSSTRFDFFLIIAESYNYQFPFVDNAFLGGNVGFFNPAITSLTDVPFQVGDNILIQQDLYEWDYDDNYFAGTLGFTSATNHNFQVGDQVNIVGQITQPSYNGMAIVTAVPDSFKIVTDKPWIASTPTEGGKAYGTITPEYNTNATIIDIYVDGVIGVVIKTNLPFAGSTMPIGGIITYLDNTVTTESFNDRSDDCSAYNARFNRLDYERYDVDYNIELYNFFTVQNGQALSTILQNNLPNRSAIQFNRIDKTAKSWLLSHNGNGVGETVYTFYDSLQNFVDDVPLGESTIETTLSDVYFPVGLFQLVNNSDRVDSGSFDLVVEWENVKYYSVAPDVIGGKPIHYRVDEECPIKTYNLVWKDSLGSWITFPFKYVARNFTDTTRSSYYKREGVFSVNDDRTVGEFTIPSTDRGESTFNTRSRDRVQLTSGWVSDYENRIFKDLIRSTEVFLQRPDILTYVEGDAEYLIDEFGNFITDEFGNKIIVGGSEFIGALIAMQKLVPVTMETNTIELKERINDSIYNYSPVVRYSFNDYQM